MSDIVKQARVRRPIGLEVMYPDNDGDLIRGLADEIERLRRDLTAWALNSDEAVGIASTGRDLYADGYRQAVSEVLCILDGGDK